MEAQIELNSIAMSKNDPKITKLEKYDVEANIEEVNNDEGQSIFKYGFTALSIPKNVRLAIEGIARISGDTAERNEILTKDENDIPKILTMIYQELFPTFFLLSKTLNVSSPPHQIGEMGEGLQEDSELSEENNTVESETVEALPVESEPEAVTQNDSEEEKLDTPDVVQPTV